MSKTAVEYFFDKIFMNWFLKNLPFGIYVNFQKKYLKNLPFGTYINFHF